MKVEPLNYSTENSGVISSSKMGIDKSGEVFIYEVLRKSLYSNPVLSVVREYSCNSFDEHVLRGIPQCPIEIALPSFEKPEFVVRDFGFGLSDEGVKNTFGMYGASTKRDSNELIGQLGIGSKSAFSIGDSFSVVSRHQGIKNIYSLVINSDGRGEVLLLNSSDTNEKSGLEVIVPVQSKDIDAFINTSLHFFSYWDVKPIIHNCFKPYPERKYQAKTANYAKIEGKDPTVVLMGNIPYKVQLDQLPDLTSGQRATFNYGWIFYVDIGQVDFSANRETLRFTSKTIKVLTDLILGAIDDYKNKLQTEFDSCSSLKEAKKVWKKVKDESLFYKYCNSIVSYKGQEIKNEYYDITLDEGTDLRTKTYNFRVKRSLVSDLKISAFQDVIYYVVGSVSNFWPRIQQLPNGTPVFACKTWSELEEFRKKNNLLEFAFTDLKLIVLPKKESNKSYSGRLVDPKHKKQVFKLNKNVYFDNDKDSWDIAEIDIEKGGVYVVLERFETCDLLAVKNFLKLGLKTEIYGIKNSLVEKGLNKKWIRLDRFIESYLNKLAKKISPKTIQKVKDFELYELYLPSLGKLKLTLGELPQGKFKRCYLEMERLNKVPSINAIKLILARNMASEIKASKQTSLAIDNLRLTRKIIEVIESSYISTAEKKDCILEIAKYN